MKNASEHTSVLDQRFQHIHMNIIGPLPPSLDYRYCLTITDRSPPWGNTNLGQSSYHDISSFVERYDRKIAQVIKLKTAITCQNTKDWTGTLSSIIPGLRTSYKFDILASAAEMLFGNPLRLRGEFFTNAEPTDPGFQDKLREHIRRVKPILPAQYAEEEFVLKDLYPYTYLCIWAQFKATRPILRRTTNIQNHKAYHR